MTAEISNRPSAAIFLADDDKDDIYFIQTAVEEISPGQEIVMFCNGAQLLEAFRSEKEERPLVVLLDLNMPVMDGRETLRQLRESCGPDLPIVILTASNHQHEKDLCFEYGATAYFTKPLSYMHYVELLREIHSQWCVPALQHSH